ncbi:MAG: prolyl oligopeptidase family serine peptidase [Wenzhouxiangellaceae bacterium]|nr:prolyl oligopeptidase family serine peptidase [Wenzhouxiangellaceae bacterium]
MISRFLLVLVSGLMLVACGPSEQGTEAAVVVPSETVAPEAAAGEADFQTYTIEQFMDTENLLGASFSADGKRVAYSSNRSGVFNVYVQRTVGGRPEQWTFSTTSPRYVQSFFPRDDRLLFSGDEGGNELDHVYLRERDGEIVDLTPGEGLKASFVGFSGDGSKFWISTNERDKAVFDLYEYSAGTLNRELLLENRFDAFLGPVSPDGRYVALSKVHLRSNTDILLWDRTTGEVTTLVADQGEVANSAQTFSADSSALYYTTDRDAQFSYLVRRELASGEETVIFQPDWDVTSAQRSRGNSYLTVTVNEDAQTVLRIFNAKTHDEIETVPPPGGTISSAVFSGNDERMAFYHGGSRQPRDLYYVSLLAGAPPPKPLTRSLNAEIDPEHLADGEVVRFDSYDGLEIPGILYRPHGASAESPVPALVMVHGGPGGQARIGYSALKQYLVNHGYAIFDINNRGSSGYGKTFYAADDRCHGECDLGDVVAGKDMLAELDWIDGDRIGIIGGSYGGYMVAAALAFQPDAFAVGVNIFGVTNWLRTLESIPAWWGPQRDALFAELGDPAVDGERLRRISPLFHAANITRPMIVLQGANDPRVLQVESDEIVQALRDNGVPVEYVLFDDEGHGFRKRANEIVGYQAIREFLAQHL